MVACSGREDQTAVARARLSAGCAINSDCVDGLVCAYGRCHVACVTARDCPGGRCVAGPASSRAAGICQLDGERACARNSDCPGTQLCGPDDVCRDACAADRDCRDGEVCAAGTCAAPADVASGAFAPRSDAVCRYASDCPGDLVCLRGRCDLECIGDKDCRVSWSCRDTRCRPPGYVATVAACLASEGTSVGGVIAAASGGGPLQVANEANAYDAFQCVVRADGQLFCRGSNDFGRLGTGSSSPAASDTYLPVAIAEPAASLALGSVQGCAIGVSGAAYCWGDNRYDGTGTGEAVANLPPSRVRLDASTFLPPVVALRASYDATCAITQAGAVYCWGFTRNEYTGAVDPDPRFHYAAVASAVAGLDVVDLGFYAQGFCVLTRAGDVYCAGERFSGVIADGNTGGGTQLTPSKVQAGAASLRGIAIGYSHACALSVNGQVLCWAGGAKEEAGVSDESVPRTTPRMVAGLQTVRKISSSDRSNFTCALLADGSVRCWGLNVHAELGVPYAAVSASAAPVTVPLSGKAVDVSVASDRACALLADGRTICWGGDAVPMVEAVPCP